MLAHVSYFYPSFSVCTHVFPDVVLSVSGSAPGSVHVPTPPADLARAAALVIEMNFDVHLVYEPMVPFSAAPTSGPSRLPVLLFSWLGENTVEGGARGACVSQSLSSSVSCTPLLWVLG